MTVTFISNYINHHQIPFSNACYDLLGDGYRFIQTEPMEQERLAMGWSSEGEKLPYVHCLYEEPELCHQLVMESDVLLAGWTEQEKMIEERLSDGKLTVRISERLYREGQWKAVSPRGLLAKYKEHTRFRKGPAYLLCAGAYVPSDFHIIRAYPGKMFQWGYFTQLREYTNEELIQMKYNDGKIHLVWAGRFIPLKHPEYIVRLAQSLLSSKRTDSSYSDFHIHMIGSGELEEQIRNQVSDSGLQEQFTFYGFKTPSEVRNIMEKCHIHLFTSNYLEGWGAVVNEAMNSGCAVVANVQAGAIPYLIKQKKNGMAYPDDSYEKMEEAVRYLLVHPEKREQMGQAAYATIHELWNAGHAAKELLRLLENLQQGIVNPPKEGPLSVAEIVAPSKMYKKMIQEAERQGE